MISIGLRLADLAGGPRLVEPNPAGTAGLSEKSTGASIRRLVALCNIEGAKMGGRRSRWKSCHLGRIRARLQWQHGVGPVLISSGDISSTVVPQPNGFPSLFLEAGGFICNYWYADGSWQSFCNAHVHKLVSRQLRHRRLRRFPTGDGSSARWITPADRTNALSGLAAKPAAGPGQKHCPPPRRERTLLQQSKERGWRTRHRRT